MEKNITFKNHKIKLELFEDAFTQFSAKIVREQSPGDWTWQESIIISKLEEKVIVYDDLSSWGAGTIRFSFEILDDLADSVADFTNEQALEYIEHFLMENYFGKNDIYNYE